MKFRHKIETININGLKEYSVQYFLCDELFIGRGSGCLIRIESRLVSLTHVRLVERDGGLLAEDLNSESGVRVNDVLVKNKLLKAGDKVKIGDVEFTVFHDGTYWGFHEIRDETHREDREKLVREQARELDISRHFPRFTTLSLLFAALVGLFFFVDPMVGKSPQLWSSGPISNQHKMIEANCRDCHSENFRPVQDKDCLECHRMSEHAARLTEASKSHAEADLRCAECHMEHNGESFTETNSQLCLDCHSNLDRIIPNSKYPSVKGFDSHPEFAVTLGDYSAGDENPTFSKVSMSERDLLLDPTRIKLNHKIHLAKDIRGPNGRVTLGCMDCHRMSNDLKLIRPVNFEEHCSSCHPLGFDERLPGKTVPHGESDVVYNFLYAEYAKLFLETERAGARQDFSRRMKPGQTLPVEQPNLDFTKRFVESETRSAENQLFTRTACFLCHEVEASGAELPGKSAFKVLKPNIPVRWMPASVFDHGAHQEMTCESCHMGVAESTQTSDVLLPGIASCRPCHQQEPETGKLSAECITCHSFHDSLLMVDSSKRTMRDIILRFR